MIRAGLTILRNDPGFEAMASAACIHIDRLQKQQRERKAAARAEGETDARAGLSCDRSRHGYSGIDNLGMDYKWGFLEGVGEE